MLVQLQRKRPKWKFFKVLMTLNWGAFVYHERRFSPSKKAYGLKQGANARKQGELALRHARCILADPKKHTTEPVLALSKKCKKKYEALPNQNKSIKNVFYACKLTRESSLVMLVQLQRKRPKWKFFKVLTTLKWVTFVYRECRFSLSKKPYRLKQGANARKRGELALRHARRILADPKKHTTEPVLALSKKCKKKIRGIVQSK